MRRILPLALILAVCAQAQDTLFTFRSDFWVNLHHFLYVLGRARSATPDSKRPAVRHVTEDVEGLDALDRASLLAWDSAISFYQQMLCGKDLVFDKDLIAITNTLAAGKMDVPDPLRRVLESAAPVYRKVWWQRHDRANRARIQEMEALLKAHGRPIGNALAKAWGTTWPSAGRTVQMAAYSNWAGAYSTDGGLLVVASLDAGNAGSQGLEILFHEAMHQWDDDFEGRMARVAVQIHATVPRSLSHSLIFYTAGYFTAKEIPGHKLYADANGLWERGMFSRERIEMEWSPYLRGERTMDDALEKLLK